jgi:hypothetical protein
MTHPKYRLQIERVSKYDYTAIVADVTNEKPESTTIMAKSMEELMAKILVALVLRDKNAGIPEDEPAPSNGELAPIVFSPSKRIITP